MKNLKLIFSVLVLALGVLSFASADNCTNNSGFYDCIAGQYCPNEEWCECNGAMIIGGNICGEECVNIGEDTYDCSVGQYCPIGAFYGCECGNDPLIGGEVCDPSPTPPSSCIHLGQIKPIWGTMTVYSALTVPDGESCTSLTIICTPTGWNQDPSSYIYTSCIVSPPPTGACSLPWGGSIASGASVTAYQSTSVSYGNTCVSQTRACNAGVLSGSFINGSCSVASNGGGGGGSYGGGSSTITNTITGDMATTAWLNPNDYTRFGDIKNSPYSQEVNLAYLYAYNIGSTTMSNVFKANLDGNLLRSHMAKMMVEWSKKVLGLKANKNIKCNFDDIDYLKKQDLYAYIIEACQMGLMGIDNHGKPQKSFDPAEVVTRGQFGTVLSRAIWGNANNGGDPFYNYHLQALKSVKIMTKISEPQNIEVRKWVMLMLHRTHKLLSK